MSLKNKSKTYGGVSLEEEKSLGQAFPDRCLLIMFEDVDQSV